MRRPLDKLTLEGFKSIRELRDLELGALNVLIGANGAGKSNFIDFFRLLRAMVQESLQRHVTMSGGADGFFFEGPRVTRKITGRMNFGPNQIDFELEPTADSSSLMWATSTEYAEAERLPNDGFFHPAIATWVVYHFHDTGLTAPMRRDWSAEDFRELRPGAENLATFLFRLRDRHSQRYQRIRETIQLVAPFFDDFLLEPHQAGPAEKLRLQWRQRGSTFPYQPWQLSDGTLRFIALTTALLQPEPPAMIVIDEPELGLHPVALSLLAALIHEAAATTQLVISTQSPLLIDHFEPEHIIVVKREAGASVFERLNSADLERWLREYTLGELVRKNVVEAGP
jgi:predicted ATPase